MGKATRYLPFKILRLADEVKILIKYVNLISSSEYFYFFTFLNRSDVKMKSFNACLLEVITRFLCSRLP